MEARPTIPPELLPYLERLHPMKPVTPAMKLEEVYFQAGKAAILDSIKTMLSLPQEGR